jgi:hypothetical protein
MLHACVQRFDVTGNLKILANFFWHLNSAGNYYCYCILPGRRDHKAPRDAKTTKTYKGQKGNQSGRLQRKTGGKRKCFFSLFPKIKPGKTPKTPKR